MSNHKALTISRQYSFRTDFPCYRRKKEFVATTLGSGEHFLPIFQPPESPIQVTVFDGGHEDGQHWCDIEIDEEEIDLDDVIRHLERTRGTFRFHDQAMVSRVGPVTTPAVWHGDCLDLMSRRLRNKSVNIVATSPPYNIGVKYDRYGDNRPDEEYLSWLCDVFAEVDRVLTDDGSFFLNVGSTPKRPFLAMQVAAVAATYFQLQNRIIWVKSIAINDHTHGHYQPINSERFLHHNFEEVFHFSKTGAVALDRLANGVPYTEERALTRWKSAAGGLHCRGDVWFVPYPTSRGPKFHPATFPPDLIEMCIRLHGFDKDTLFLDPFAGIGTSLQACQRVGIRGVGIEISEKYVEEAQRRLCSLDNETSQPKRRDIKPTVSVLDLEDIDRKVQERLEAIVLSAEPSNGPGRPNETRKLAELIDEMKDRGCSWQQATAELNKEFPNENFNRERVRKIWTRHFGKNRRK